MLPESLFNIISKLKLLNMICKGISQIFLINHDYNRCEEFKNIQFIFQILVSNIVWYSRHRNIVKLPLWLSKKLRSFPPNLLTLFSLIDTYLILNVVVMNWPSLFCLSNSIVEIFTIKISWRLPTQILIQKLLKQ